MISRSKLPHYIRQRIESQTLYHTAFATGKKVCDRCSYKNPFQDYCRRFHASLKRINQRNGGFHHEPCILCSNHTITDSEINYLIQCYNNRRKL